MNTVVPSGRFVRPDAVVTHFHLRDGDRVADFGAGAGAFATVLSKAVGKNGKVYACEIQRNLIERLGHLKHESKISNLEPLWVDLENPASLTLPDSVLDAGILVNTLFQIENKEAALSAMHRTIQPGGKLIVVDWSESYGGMGPADHQVLEESRATELVSTAGFSFHHSFDAGAHHYGLMFRKV